MQNELFSLANNQRIEKIRRVSQNATTKFRVPIKITTNRIAGRTHELCKKASCCFVSSMGRNRAPKFNKIIKIPIKYGFEFKLNNVFDKGSIGPIGTGAEGTPGIEGGGGGTVVVLSFLPRVILSLLFMHIF
jgi:hypothetical protein